MLPTLHDVAFIRVKGLFGKSWIGFSSILQCTGIVNKKDPTHGVTLI